MEESFLVVIYCAIEHNSLNNPKPEKIVSFEQVFPDMFVGDEAYDYPNI